MSIIFPAHDIASTMSVALAEYRSRYSNAILETTMGSAAITAEQCLPVVVALVQEAVDSRMLWLHPTGRHASHTLDRAMNALFPHYGTDTYQEQRDHLYSRVLDESWLAVQSWVELAVKQPTWNLWFVRQVGSDILLESGEDYRVMDWKRRIESGEWSMEDHLTPPAQPQPVTNLNTFRPRRQRRPRGPK